MSKVAVWKYPVPVDDVFTITMPRGAQILTVQVQHGLPCVWALVDDGAEPTDRGFVLLGTGHAIPRTLLAGCDYVGSFQLEDGALVFHLWAEGPSEIGAIKARVAKLEPPMGDVDYAGG